MSDSDLRREHDLVAALLPFARACSQIDRQYDVLAFEHGEQKIRRPSADSLSMTFSYETLRAALDAFEKWAGENGLATSEQDGSRQPLM